MAKIKGTKIKLNWDKLCHDSFEPLLILNPLLYSAKIEFLWNEGRLYYPENMAKIRFYGRAGRIEKNNVWDHAFLKMLHWRKKYGKILSSLVIDFTYLLKELDWRIYSAWFCTQLYLHWQRNWSSNCKKKHQCNFFLILPLLKNRDRDHFLAYGAEQSWHF